MAFQTPGDHVEASINPKKAMEHVLAYVMGGRSLYGNWFRFMTMHAGQYTGGDAMTLRQD